MNLQHIFVLTVLVHAAFASMRVNVSLFALNLGASAFTVGVIMALAAFLPMLASVHTGRMIDRIGPRRPMVAGAALIAAATALPVAWFRLEALFVVSTVAGVGFLLFHIAVHQAVGSIGVEHERTRNFSLLALGFSTSSFLGPMLAGFSIDLFGYRATFALSAVVGAVALVAAHRDKADSVRPGEHAPPRRRHLLELLHERDLRMVLVVSGMLSMCWDLFTFAVPIYGVRIGLSASQIGIILGTFGVAICIVRLLIPFMARHAMEWKVLIGAMVVTALSFAAFPLITSTAVLMGLAFVCGFGLGAAQPMIMALIYDYAPKGRAGEAVGIRSLFLNISQTAVPLASGAFGAALGMMPAFWTMAVLLAAGSWYAGRHR